MAIEYYSSIDLNKNELQNAVIQNAGSQPGSPAEGQIYFDNTSGDKALHYYNGSAWVRVAGSTTHVPTDTISSGDFIAFSDESEDPSSSTANFENKLTVDNLFKTAPAVLSTAAIANGDFIMFLDGGATGETKLEALADVATLFAGSGLTATNSVIAVDTLNQDTTGTATNSLHTLVTDNESTDEENQITFVEGAAGGGAQRGLEADGDFTYNPSSGTVTATIFKGNIDAVDGDFDGTLEADALTVGGTNILTGGIITTLGTIAQDTVIFTSANDNDPLIQIKSTGNNTNSGRLQFVKDKGAAGADGDDVGQILFTGDDAGQAQTDFAKILVEVGEADNTDEAGKLTIGVASSDGTNTGLTSGLVLTGHKTADYVDVTLGNGTDSTVTIPGNLTVTGTTTTVNVTTTTTSSGVVFEGTTGDGHDATLKSVVAGADVTYTLPNVGGHVALFAADPSTTTISSTPAELNKLDGATVVVSEINMLDLGSTAVGNAIASKAVVLDSNKDYDGIRNFTLSGELDAGSLDISGNADIDGTLETDALTIGGAAVLAQATASAVGAVELATAAEVITGTDTARVVTADTLSAKSVACDIDVSSLTDANIVTITHNLGTADIVVQVYDKTTEANIMCDIARTTDDFSTASTSVVSIDFGTAPPNDCRALITSLAGATAGSIAYT